MSGLPARAFSTNASRSQFNSVPSLFKPQGGGDKKAGLKPTSEMTQWRNIYYNSPTAGINYLFYPFSKTGLTVTANPRVCVSRPVGSFTQGNVYWKCKGIVQNEQMWNIYPKLQ